MIGRVVPQRALLILPSTGAFDSRAYRIATFLAERGHDVTILARAGDGLPEDETHAAGYRTIRVPTSAADGLPRPLRDIAVRGRSRRPQRPTDEDLPAGRGGPRPSRVRRAIAGVRRLAAIALVVRSQQRRSRVVAPPADLIHAMAYMGIPIGLALGGRSVPVIYDARDIYVDARNLARLPSPARRLFARIERSWARRAARVVTVNEPYAKVMAERWKVPAPLVVLNCSFRQEPWVTRPDRIRNALGLPSAAHIVLYHGGLSPDRGIEQLIEGLPAFGEDAHLVLLGYGPLEAELHERASDVDVRGRLHVLPAVPPSDLLEWVASADVVAMPIQPSTLNHRLTTPNKLFEAMAAGVPIVASDLPGMAGIVAASGCGRLVDPTDPAAIAAAIRELLALPGDERRAIGARGFEAHRSTYNWERQAEVLVAEYGRLTGRPW